MANHAPSRPSPPAPPIGGRLPGEPGVWVLIAGDLLIFAVFFSTFLFYHEQERSLFAQSQRALNQNIGLWNTLLLLTSSWFVANAVQQVRAGNRERSTALLAMTLLCACGFLVNKGIEWTQLIGAHHTLLTDDFYMFFFMLTGIHALHVVIGMAVLAFLRSRIASGQYPTGNDGPAFPVIESGALFWHLVDLLWIVLFSLFYLVQ